MALVFISHAHADETLARKVAALLGDALGLTPADFFLSSQEGRGVAPSASIRKAIIEELRTVPALIVLITPRAAISPWVWLEAGNRLGCADRSSPIFLLPSGRFMSLLAPVSDMRGLQLDNDGELHELVHAVSRNIGKPPQDFLSYKPALEDVVRTVTHAYALGSERRARAMSWVGRHAIGLVLALAGAVALAAAGRTALEPPPDVQTGGAGDVDALQEMNNAIAASASRFLVLKGRVTNGQTGVHGATVMVARDGERTDPDACEEPECTKRTTTTDGEFTINLTRIQVQNGDPVVMSVVRDGFEFFSRELEVDVRAMDVRTAPQNVILASRSLP
jgi:hypothetical protein